MCRAPLLLLVFIVSCSGCSLLRTSTLTESSPLNVPAHTGRNQFSGQAGYGGKRGFDGSVSYALTDHVALGGSLFINHQVFQDNPIPGWTSSYLSTMRSNYGEGQVSYYGVLKQSFAWAATGGYGSGSRQFQWLENQLDSRYSRYFIQATGNWISASNQWAGFGVKLHYTNYTSASLQDQANKFRLTLPGVNQGMLGIDLVQTVRLPLSTLVSFSGQWGAYVPLGQLRLVPPGGSLSFNTYSNIGVIATAGLVVSLPVKHQR